MYPILKREFIDSFKSIRSMLITLFITVAAYQSASYFNSNPSVINEMLFEGVDNNAAYAAVISLILMVLGFLFAFAISHDLINKEIELKTIRLLITKTSCLRSEEHTSELQSRGHLVCRLLLEKKKKLNM